MTIDEIYARIWDENAYMHLAWSAFCSEMVDKQYGAEPLNQAWGFFKSGWEARNHELRRLRQLGENIKP